METIVLKFGGSSLASNDKLNIVAKKVIDFYNQGKRIVVVVSAQGKTTDHLIAEAKELAQIPLEREMDTLLSTGEQISISKLSILLNNLGYSAISLTGWQAGIYTSEKNQDAKIEKIDTSRIEKELNNNNIVIVAGFQGINKNGDITTLGRGGSDTTAVAIAAAIKAKHCYIFSDVDGVYSTDPNKIPAAKKLDSISYKEMLNLSDEGAKVLHNRCVEIAERHNVLIETGSTFNNNIGTIICDKMEETSVKSIVKNDDLYLITLKGIQYSNNIFEHICKTLLQQGISIATLINKSTEILNMCFTIKASQVEKLKNVIKNKLKGIEYDISNISRISVVGYGISNDEKIITKIFEILKNDQIEILSMQIDECKISVMANKKIEYSILEELHSELIA